MQIREAIAGFFLDAPADFNAMVDELQLDRRRVGDFIASGDGLTIGEVQRILSYLGFTVVEK